MDEDTLQRLRIYERYQKAEIENIVKRGRLEMKDLSYFIKYFGPTLAEVIYNRYIKLEKDLNKFYDIFPILKNELSKRVE